MKKFQLEPTNNLGLINVILDKIESLGYYNSSRGNFTTIKQWQNPAGQYIQVGYTVPGHANRVFRSPDPIETDEYPIISLDEFFKLTVEECNEKNIKVCDGKHTITINQNGVYLPHRIVLSRNEARDLAEEILEVMQ